MEAYACGTKNAATEQVAVKAHARKRQSGNVLDIVPEGTPTEVAEHAQAFLKDFSGWLYADGYQGYHKMPENIRVVGCWAHARQKFDEVLQILPKEKRQESPAATGECYCTRLFQLEQSLADLTPEEQYNLCAGRFNGYRPKQFACVYVDNDSVF